MRVSVNSLGSREYKEDYNVRYPYASGGMVHAISSVEMVVRMGKAGMIGYFGSGALKPDAIENAIECIQRELSEGQAYGMNVLNGPAEEYTVDLCLKHNVRNIEAAAYMEITPALVRFRLQGLEADSGGKPVTANRIMAKVSRPEIARLFLSPPPEEIVRQLLKSGQTTPEQADLAGKIPMADDLCVEADSGGHTDGAVAYTLLPFMRKVRDEMMEKHAYAARVRVGAAGGIGTPESAAASFIMGADFVLTGSINHCSVEAGTSDLAKDMMQAMEIQDTDYAPAGDMFEIGARVQVLKKGVFFPARANKLYDLYRYHDRLDEIDPKTRAQLQERYFRRTFNDVYEECKKYYSPAEIERAEMKPKQKMAYIFRWYFGFASRMALRGNEQYKVDFQIHCGPALGAFNRWVRGSDLESWRNRHVDDMGLRLMHETAELLGKRYESFGAY